jgi:hypothetical protein
LIGCRQSIARRAKGEERISRLRAAGPGLFVVLAFLVVQLSSMAFAPGARAVLIAGPDGTINTTAPSPDPGFANVGRIVNFTGVYLGNGWVITAFHVAENPIVLEGSTYDPVPGSSVRLTTSDGDDSDLRLFKLVERPPLPDVVLPSSALSRNEDLVLIGNGLNRSNAFAPGDPWEGWHAGGGRTIRWGTNQAERRNLTIQAPAGVYTQGFSTVFDQLSPPNADDPEAQAVNGDSGGPVFAWNGNTPELVGLLFAVNQEDGQPTNSAAFGNEAFAADVYRYRDQILDVITQPECDNGLDDDGDGVADHPNDPGCDDAIDDSELSESLECDNGADDDGDLLIDFPADPGCDDLLDPSEVPEPGLALGLAFGSLMLGALRIRPARAR